MTSMVYWMIEFRESGVFMLEKDIYPQIAAELKVQPHQVEAAAKLLDEGNTVPFIARYRKEATGWLEDVIFGVIVPTSVY